MMNNPFLARFADNEPALVASDKKGLFEASLHHAAIIQTKLDADATQPKMVDDFWFADDDWRAALRPYVVKDSILHIPVKGVLLHDFPYAFGSWATGYEYIWRAFSRGQVDGNVRGIALVSDSPGGMVAGCFDLVDKIAATENRKPLRAYAQESAYSAAYAIVAVADSITVSRTGGVGSIGVVTAHMDVSKALDAAGIKVTFIHFGKHKVDGNATESLKPEVKERIQARIDELGEVFVSSVARNRGMEADAVRATEALTYTATQAVSNGLADSIGSLDDAIAAFAADLSLDEEDETMKTEAEKAAEQAAATQAAHDAAVATARAEGMKAGVAAERSRITAIIDSDVGKARPKAALSAALKTEMSADAAKAFLGDLDEEKAATPTVPAAGGTPFDAAMGNGNPELGAANQGDGKDGNQPVPRAERAFQAAGFKSKAA